MKAFSLVFYLSFFFLTANAQTHVSKRCGSCHKPVSANSRVGQRCPHCGVKWGYENESRSTDIPNRSNNTTYPKSLSDYIEEEKRKSDYYPSTNYDYPYSSGSSSYNSSDFTYEQSTVVRRSNLRSAPSTDSEVLGILPKNASIVITKFLSDWVKVEYRDSNFNLYIGWLYRSNVVY